MADLKLLEFHSPIPMPELQGDFGRGCVYFHNGLVWATLEVGWDGESLILDMACDPLASQHWLQFEMDQVGLHDALGAPPGGDPLDMIVWMMDQGIAPEIPFMVEMSYDSWRDYWGEWDSVVRWRLLNRELDMAAHLEAWMGYFWDDASTLPKDAPWRHAISRIVGEKL